MLVADDTTIVGVRADFGGGSSQTGASSVTGASARSGLPVALTSLAVTVFATAVPALPSGVCMGDAGELQLAGAVLGIAHSPGYAAYITLAHLATLVPGLSPAYSITLLCLTVGVASLALATALATRMGVNPWVASAATLGLTSHPRVWQNIITPEVYILSIAILLAAACSMTAYLRHGRRKHLLVAAFLLGVAIANRPPVLLVAPFFLWSWWKSPRRVHAPRHETTRTLSLLVLFASLPGVYSLAYFFVRDTPDSPYNYIEQHNAETPELPRVRDGVAARIERVLWLVTAREFYYLAGSNWGQIRAKLRWMRYELLGREFPLAAAVVILSGLGLFRALRRAPGIAWLVIGIALHAFLYGLYCRNSGQAADTLPLLFFITIFAAFGFGEVFNYCPARSQTVIAICVFAVAVACTVRDLPDRPKYGAQGDAVGFLADVRLAEMPDDAIILTNWTYAAALLYERILNTNRNDIDIIISQPGNWSMLADQHPGHPVYVSANTSVVANRRPTFEHNLWRLNAPEGPRSPAADQPTSH